MQARSYDGMVMVEASIAQGLSDLQKETERTEDGSGRWRRTARSFSGLLTTRYPLRSTSFNRKERKERREEA
jgi:hypothetical protein